MGLTNRSMGKKLLSNDIDNLKKNSDYVIAIAGNPNVGKSTIFNGLTGMNQHTGNWPGKTVENSNGICNYKNKKFLLVDIPGTYSIMSNSQEEEIARDYICFGNPDATVIILDATCLERNLNLVYQIMEITSNIVVCVNLLDEAKKKGITVNLKLLEKRLGVPVVGTIARKKKTLDKLMDKVTDVLEKRVVIKSNKIKYIPIIEDCIKILESKVQNILPKRNEYLLRWICLKLIDREDRILYSIQKNLELNFDDKQINDKLSEVQKILERNDIKKEDVRDKVVSSIVFEAENVSRDVIQYKRSDYRSRDRRIDKILTSKLFGIPIMIAFLASILWITIVGANYPSSLLSELFGMIKEFLIKILHSFGSPEWIRGILIDGIYSTVTWVTAVMLPPMAIFFPLFTLLEDLGVLPRIAFNLDKYFKKACSSGKQALTMCMGLGCNAAGVVGTRIIDSPREKLISILTNVFVPCNGRFPFLITIATVFVGSYFTGIFSSIVSTLTVLIVIILGIMLTLIISKILSKTILKGIPNSFILELPPYRRPQIGKILVRSIFDRTLFVLRKSDCSCGTSRNSYLDICKYSNI